MRLSSAVRRRGVLSIIWCGISSSTAVFFPERCTKRSLLITWKRWTSTVRRWTAGRIIRRATGSSGARPWPETGSRRESWSPRWRIIWKRPRPAILSATGTRRSRENTVTLRAGACRAVSLCRCWWRAEGEKKRLIQRTGQKQQTTSYWQKCL